MFGARDHNFLHFPKHRKSIQLKVDCDTNFRLFYKKNVFVVKLGWMWVFSVECVSPTTLGHFRKSKKNWKRKKTTGRQAAVSIGMFPIFGKWNRRVRKGINRRTSFDFSLLFQKHKRIGSKSTPTYIHGFFAGSFIKRVGSSKTWSWRSFDLEIFQNLGPEFCDSEF
jgi:hypothetical protein